MLNVSSGEAKACRLPAVIVSQPRNRADVRNLRLETKISRLPPGSRSRGEALAGSRAGTAPPDRPPVRGRHGRGSATRRGTDGARGGQPAQRGRRRARAAGAVLDDRRRGRRCDVAGASTILPPLPTAPARREAATLGLDLRGLAVRCWNASKPGNPTLGAAEFDRRIGDRCDRRRTGRRSSRAPPT